MADLHRTHRGDSFHPSSSSASVIPIHATTTAPLPPSSLPETTADQNHPPPPPPPPRSSSSAMAPTSTAAATVPSTPPPGAFRRCGWRVRGVCMGCFGDAEAKRRRRVAGYKAYGVEGKVKASLRRGIRWFKRKCSGIFRV